MDMTNLSNGKKKLKKQNENKIWLSDQIVSKLSKKYMYISK